MKIKRTVALVSSILVTGVSFAANDLDGSSKELQVYPKNLARQHLGANLLAFNPTSQTYVPTEAAAAWLDDDIATGWPTNKGTSYYLVALPGPELLTNFSVSARNTAGTVNLYTSDELAPPSAKTWNPIAKNVSIEALNDRKMERPFSRFAKYLLIEADLKEAGPLYSLHLFGERPAVSYRLEKRTQSVDMRSLLGPYTNPQTSINLSSLSASARVVQSNPDEGFVPSQKAVDDNPESELSIAPSTSQPGIVIKYSAPQDIDRISVLADGSTAGKLEFFMINSDVPKTAVTAVSEEESQYIKVNNSEKAGSSTKAENASIEGLTPIATVTFDGTNPRASIDFPTATGTNLMARWTPETPGQALKVREIASFGAISMNDYQLSRRDVRYADSDSSKDGKDFKDPKDFKDSKEPIGELLPTKTPYVPGQPKLPPPLVLSN